MNCFTLDLAPDGLGKLTGYIQEPSPELSNMNRRPALLIFPGGGYQRCSDREAEPVALSFSAQGFQTFVLRYSIKEKAKFPQPLLDAEGAIRALRTHADEWNLDPERIAVCGFSAGAHLAACLATMSAPELRPNALVLGYGAVDRSLHSPERPCPVEHVDPDTPPTFLFHTWEDPVVPVANSLSFAQALNKYSIPFEVHIFQNGQHGMATGKSLSSNGILENTDVDFSDWTRLCANWLFHQFGSFELPGRQFSYLTAEDAKAFTGDVQLGDLLRYPKAREVVLKYLPDIERHVMPRLVSRYSVYQYSKFDPETLPPEKAEQLAKELEALPYEG